MAKTEPRGRIPQLYREMKIGQRVIVNYKGGDVMKVVRPYHGTDGAMGYKYRARTESRTAWVGWFRNRRQVTQRRFVIERYFMSWSDYLYSRWLECDENDIKQRGSIWLDHKAAAPSGDYV